MLILKHIISCLYEKYKYLIPLNFLKLNFLRLKFVHQGCAKIRGARKDFLGAQKFKGARKLEEVLFFCKILMLKVYISIV